MLTFISFILVFGSVVLFHEFGHFIVAKLSGIRINEFAIGMGPQFFKIKGKETEYSLRLFPIGGFVSMEGENEESDDDRSFQKKGPLTRILVVAAGPIMNFVLATLLFVVIGMFNGIETNQIGNLSAGMPAQTAGIEVGDVVTAIDGNPVSTWSELTQGVVASKGQPMTFTVNRDGTVLDITVSPQFDAEQNRYMVGVSPYYKHSLVASFKYGIATTARVTGMIVDYIPKLFKGNNFVNDVVGPVGIVVMIGEASKTGFLNVVGLAALISINLGLMNLLPIPALDGGRILFLFIELIFRKPVKEEWEANIHKIGFILLIGLTIVVFIKDIFKFWP